MFYILYFKDVFEQNNNITVLMPFFRSKIAYYLTILLKNW